jgi:hypothetical protein
MAYDASPSSTHNPSTGGTPTAAWGDIINGNFEALGGAWTSYTPTWTAASVNPAIGNGTLTGAYLKIGKLYFFRIYCLAGGTTTFGTGAYSWSLGGGVTSIAREQLVSASAVNAGVTRYRGVGIIAPSATTVQIQADDSGNVAAPTVPTTWNATDWFTISGCIEVA